MNETGFMILAESFWQNIVEVFTTPSLQLFLLLGSFILVISLLLLTMTRLGHARPITKCVVLSVIAHVLLLGYAYGTKLIFHVPVVQKDKPISVNLVNDDFEEPIEDPEPAADDLVDEYDDSVIPQETIELPRPEPEVPFELERVVDLPEIPTESEKLEPKPLIEIADLQNQKPDFNIESPDIDFEPEESIEDVSPQESDFQRRGEGEDELQDHMPEVEPGSSKLEPSDELENVEIEPKILNQDTFESAEQRAEQYESDLVVPEADHSVVDDAISASSPDPIEIESQVENGKHPDVNPIPDPRRLGDGQILPETYQLRASQDRVAEAEKTGGSQQTEDAVKAALQWLATVQKEDGRWAACEHEGGKEDQVFGHNRGGCGSNADTGITALAALAFMGAGNSHLEGEFRINVQKALEFLIRRQASNGDLSGDAKLFARMYCHSMSLLALSEAFAVTGDIRLKQPVNAGLNYTLSAQDPRGGGWRYQPGDSGDMSQFGWKVMAIKSAILAGIHIDSAVMDRMEKFLRSCETGKHGGLASYRPGEGPSTTMTAEALACKLFMKQTISKNSLQESQLRLLSELPSLRRANLYYWYYATLALHQSGGESWNRWNNELQRVLLAQQVNSGDSAGSWDPDGVWGGYGGRIYSTALATMCLEVYYRYQSDGDDTTKAASVAIPSDKSTPWR